MHEFCEANISTEDISEYKEWSKNSDKLFIQRYWSVFVEMLKKINFKI